MHLPFYESVSLGITRFVRQSRSVSHNRLPVPDQRKLKMFTCLINRNTGKLDARKRVRRFAKPACYHAYVCELEYCCFHQLIQGKAKHPQQNCTLYSQNALTITPQLPGETESEQRRQNPSNSQYSAGFVEPEDRPTAQFSYETHHRDSAREEYRD